MTDKRDWATERARELYQDWYGMPDLGNQSAPILAALREAEERGEARGRIRQADINGNTLRAVASEGREDERQAIEARLREPDEAMKQVMHRLWGRAQYADPFNGWIEQAAKYNRALADALFPASSKEGE